MLVFTLRRKIPHQPLDNFLNDVNPYMDKIILEKGSEIQVNGKTYILSDAVIVEQIFTEPQVEEVVERPQVTLENKSGHAWFNGTSWGVK